jgi:8-oxo-dGTP diphosphatase
MSTALDAPRVGIAVFIWKDGKFLVSKRLSSHGHDTWSIPGGKLEHGETWEACASREVREETGLSITNTRFLAATNDLFDSGQHFVTIWVEADWAAGEPTVSEPDKLAEHTWATYRTLPSPLFEPCWANLRAAKPELFA